MNQKRSHSSKKSSSSWKSNRVDNPQNQVELNELSKANRAIEQTADLHQSTPLNRFLRFKHQNSYWSYFNRGLFWGGLVSLTSICSAIAGMALTKVDFVEQQISARLQKYPAKLAAVEPDAISTPLQILLVEVESDVDAMVGFGRDSAGKSKTILLLKVEPELDIAQVINVPLDTKANIPGLGEGTVADAYTIGGMDLLSQTIDGLNEGIKVDRYLRTSEEVFQQLTDSGKITLNRCDPTVRDCPNLAEQVIHQETAFKTIRQRFNIPTYLESFQTTVERIEPQLDTNLSTAEIMEVANFIKELEPDRLNVELVPRYTPGKAIAGSDRLTQPALATATREQSQTTDENPFRYSSVAVQNTTNNPELGRRVVAYLRQQNFRDVYLVKQMPLKLKQTKIVTNYGQVERANYLKNILGFGNLESRSSLAEQELVLQLGEDALSLPTYPDYK